jgi:hypothetical protein
MRLPNPWVAIPVVLGLVGGGVIGGVITQLSCAPGSCLGAAVGIGVVSALVVAAGIGVVVVLALRSIAEWRDTTDISASPPPRDPSPPTC